MLAKMELLLYAILVVFVLFLFLTYSYVYIIGIIDLPSMTVCDFIPPPLLLRVLIRVIRVGKSLPRFLQGEHMGAWVRHITWLPMSRSSLTLSHRQVMSCMCGKGLQGTISSVTFLICVWFTLLECVECVNSAYFPLSVAHERI